MGFLPRGQLIALLRPVHECGFVTPFKQPSHHCPMRRCVHERLHCVFIRPTSGSPKDITTLAKQLRPEISIRFSGLAGCAKSLQKKHRQIAPETNSQTCDGNHGHIESLSRAVPMSMPSEAPADLLSRLSARTINIGHICPPLGRRINERSHLRRGTPRTGGNRLFEEWTNKK